MAFRFRRLCDRVTQVASLGARLTTSLPSNQISSCLLPTHLQLPPAPQYKKRLYSFRLHHSSSSVFGFDDDFARYSSSAALLPRLLPLFTFPRQVSIQGPAPAASLAVSPCFFRRTDFSRSFEETRPLRLSPATSITAPSTVAPPSRVAPPLSSPSPTEWLWETRQRHHTFLRVPGAEFPSCRPLVHT